MTIGTGFMRVHWEYAEVTKDGFLINHLMCKNKNKYKKWNVYERNLVINVNYPPTPKVMGWASEVSTPTNVGSSFRVLVSVPDTLFFKAKFLILIAALTSRFNKVPQLPQVHSRSLSCRSLLMCPQQEQVLLLGSNVPIFKMFLPYQFALYSNIVTNIPHPASLIDLASLWFLSMFDTCNVSIAKLSWLLISSLETLCKKSLRLFATFSCIIANFWFVLLPLYFENLRCVYFNFDSALRRNFGLSYSVPSDETIKDFIPRSIPIVVSLSIFTFDLTSSPVSQSIETKYLPVGVLLIVACLIVPLIGLCRFISIPPLNLGATNLLPFNDTLCGMLKLPPLDFFLKFGNSERPLKKLVYALSRLAKDCCRDCELISFNHSHSFFKSVNCLDKSKQDKLVCAPAQAICLVSKAKLYTNLTAPICLFNNSDCDFVGYNLYLNAFNKIEI